MAVVLADKIIVNNKYKAKNRSWEISALSMIYDAIPLVFFSSNIIVLALLLEGDWWVPI